MKSEEACEDYEVFHFAAIVEMLRGGGGSVYELGGLRAGPIIGRVGEGHSWLGDVGPKNLKTSL